jgi:hypothetical protein
MEGSMMAAPSHSNAQGPIRRAFAFLAQLPEAMLLTIEGWRERALLRRELDDLNQRGELERTLVDCGISPSELPRLMRAHPRARQQLAEMMERLGIDRAALARRPAAAEALRAIDWRCGGCTAWLKCRAWLASRDAPERYRAFCPNAAALDELRRSESAVSGGVLIELASEKGAPRA